MKLVSVYKTRLGKPGDYGDWDIYSGTTHAVLTPSLRTFCNRLLLPTRDGRIEHWDGSRKAVSCKLCLRRITPMEV